MSEIIAEPHLPPIDSADDETASSEGAESVRSETDRRVLMLGRGSHDQALLERTLGGDGVPFEVCRDVESLAAEMASGAALLAVGAEMIKPRIISQLLSVIDRQPVWSDLPVIVFRGKPSVFQWVDDWMPELGNVTVLESPTKKTSVLTAVRAALRDRERQYRFRELLESLEETEERKNRFLVRLGHDVRNPLAVITTALSLLESAEEGNGAAQRDKILRQTRILARLIDDLLNVSGLTVGKVPLGRRAVDLGEIVDAGMERFALAAEAERRGLGWAVEPAPAPVDADPDSLEQVLYNLVQTAFHRTPRGGRVEVSTASDGESSVLSVRALADDGPAAGAGESPPPSRAGGEGLELLKSVVALQDGRLVLDETGSGAAFAAEVRLPRGSGRRRRVGEAEAARTDAPARRDEPVDNPRILVVEDNNDGREALRELLGLWDYEVTVASGGDEALERLDEVRPGVALVDIGLPDIDGYQVAAAARERFGSAVRLIAMTGYGQPEDRKRALEAGFDLHLVKPVEPARLFELLSDLVERRGA